MKVLYAADGLVDGHDLANFRLKPVQLAALHRDLPALRPHCTGIIDRWDGPDWSAYAMPLVSGRRLVQLLEAADGLPAFERRFAVVVDRLVRHGYAARTSPAPPDWGRRHHLDRVVRRLPLLAAELPAELIDGPALRIGPFAVPPLARQVARLEEQLSARPEFAPPVLRYPVHGDLNLGNVLVTGVALDAFTVLDPRGITEDWDLGYDLAKCLFSLAGHEEALSVGFLVQRGADGYSVRLRSRHPAYRAAAGGFLGLLEAQPALRELLVDDPEWRQRLLLSHAVHWIAEAACRLSDRKPRQFGSVAAGAAHRELAVGLLLGGLVLLDDVLGRGRAAEGAAAHLALLEQL